MSIWKYLKTSWIFLKILSYFSVNPANLNSYLVWSGLTALTVRRCFGSVIPCRGTLFIKILVMVSSPIDKLMSLSMVAYQMILRLDRKKLPFKPGFPFMSYIQLDIAMYFSYAFIFSSKLVSNLISFNSQMSQYSCSSSKMDEKNLSSITFQSQFNILSFCLISIIYREIIAQSYIKKRNYNLKMSLKKIEIRYFPPGLNIQLKQNNRIIKKQLNLYSLRINSIEMDIERYVQDILIPQQRDTLILHKKQLCEAIEKIYEKHNSKKGKNYRQHLKLKTHKQPLTNCTFSKYGNYFATASYDRTCKIWESSTGKLVNSLVGHRNAVFCLAFSHFSLHQIIATGSFDHTARVWGLNGKLLQNFTGHTGEITSVQFNPNGLYLCTSSLDGTARVWDIEKGKNIYELKDHSAEVVSLHHNYLGDQIVTCSFDKTAIIWDLKSGKLVTRLQGHSGEVNCCKFEYTGEICATGSADRSCIVWDIGMGKPLQVIEDAQGDILDIDFNLKGDRLVTGSADSVVRMYNVDTSSLLYTLKGHEREITKVKFNPQGDILLSTGFDGIGRIWDVQTGKNISLLQGHEDEIFSCDISYYGQNIITCSKDNSCIIWKRCENVE